MNGNKTEKRRELDFYPTPPSATRALMDFFNFKNLVIWEPACGDGAMPKTMAEYGNEIVSTDLRHTGFGQGGIDFLKTNKRVDAIITNPPFYASHLFIPHAIQNAPIVALLLKSQYWHAKKRSSIFGAYAPAFVMPLTWRPNFYGATQRGASVMEVLWTVWIDGFSGAQYHPLSEPKNMLGDLI